MKRILFLLVIAALALPATAFAKGPSEASIKGPALGKTVSITGPEEPGSPLMDFAEQAGFFPAAYSQEPNPMLKSEPKGNLGPKYTVTYTVPGPNNDTAKVKQDIYPYATPYPVTYMKPGQEFFDGQKTHGGWFLSYAALKDTLVSAGLPKVAPSGSSSAGDGRFSTGTVSILALALALLLGASAAIFMRRRARPATAT